MGQAKNRAAEIKELKNGQGNASRKYGKLLKEGKDGFGNVCRIYDASALGLEQYRSATGKLPYEVELAESNMGLQLHHQVMAQYFDKAAADRAVADLECGSWRDMIVVVERNGKEQGFGFRVDAEDRSKEVAVPAYGTEVELTALELGLARMIITWQAATGYCQQFGKGPKKAVRTSAMSLTTADDAYNCYVAALSATDMLESDNLRRFLD